MILNLRNASIWAICLASGALIGLLMVPIELAVMVVAYGFGARDIDWKPWFVLTQFTDVRALRDMYPLRRTESTNE